MNPEDVLDAVSWHSVCEHSSSAPQLKRHPLGRCLFMACPGRDLAAEGAVKCEWWSTSSSALTASCRGPVSQVAWARTPLADSVMVAGRCHTTTRRFGPP